MKTIFAKVKNGGLSVLLVLGAALGFAASSQASLVPVCTASQSPYCTPDFNVINGSWSYTTNAGTGNGGTLALTGATGGNISFHIDSILDGSGVAYTAADDNAFGDSNLNADLLGFNIAAPFSTFSLTLDVDGSGDVTGGSITLNGQVRDWIHGAANYVQTLSGTDLNGLLLQGDFSGSPSGGIGFDTANNKIAIGLTGGTVTSGLLLEFAEVFAINIHNVGVAPSE